MTREEQERFASRRNGLEARGQKSDRRASHTGADPVIRSYRDLHVWQKGIDLVAESYRLARQLPKDERFALSAQLRRAAVSVPANIAEGCGLSSRRSYVHHLRIARGSLLEVETLLHAAIRVQLLREHQCTPAMRICDDVSRMLTALLRKLEKDVSSAERHRA